MAGGILLLGFSGCQESSVYNYLEEVGARVKLDPYEAVHTVQFAYKDSVPDALKDLPKELRALELQGTQINSEHLESWKTLPELHTLDLTSTGIDDASVKILKNYSKLEVLHLADTTVRGTGFINLVTLKKLKKLSVANCKLLPEATNHISGLKQIRSLDLRSSGINDDSLSPLTHIQ